jgi:hypothetical protein
MTNTLENTTTEAGSVNENAMSKKELKKMRKAAEKELQEKDLRNAIEKKLEAGKVTNYAEKGYRTLIGHTVAFAADLHVGRTVLYHYNHTDKKEPADLRRAEITAIEYKDGKKVEMLVSMIVECGGKEKVKGDTLTLRSTKKSMKVPFGRYFYLD